MTDETFDSVNSLGSMYFVAGNDVQLIFNMINGQTGLPLNLGSVQAVSLNLCPYGQEDFVVPGFPQPGSVTDIVNGEWIINLKSNITSSLNGVYTAQPKIQVLDGDGFVRYYYPGNIVLNISKLIQ